MADTPVVRETQIDAHGQPRQVSRPGRERAILIEIASRLAATSDGFSLPPSAGEDVDDQLLQKAERDAVIAKAINLFRGRIAAESYWHADDREQRALVPYYRAIMRCCQNWPQARLNACNALLEGRGGLRIIGDTVDMRMPGDTEIRTWWVPRWLWPIGQPQIDLGWDEREIVHETGDRYTSRVPHWRIKDLIRNEWYKVEKQDLRQYCIFTFGTTWDTMGGGRGLLHSLASFSRDATHVRETMIRGTMRFAYPFIIVQLADETTWGDDEGDSAGFDTPEEIGRRIADALNKMAGGQVLVIGASDKVTPVSMDGPAGDSLLKILNFLYEGCVGLLLAATMPTGGGGDAGSYSRAAIEQGSTDDYLRIFRQILEDGFNPLAQAIHEHNRENWVALGLDHLSPLELRLGQERVDNPADGAARLEAASRIGLPVGYSHAYEALEIEEPSDQEYEEGRVLFAPPPPEDVELEGDPAFGDEFASEGMNDGGVAA